MPQNQLTLYFLHSPLGMDWSSPAKLAWSALRNRLTFRTHFMGHVFVEFEYGGKRELTGMSGKNLGYFKELLINGRGLGILFHSFEGELQEKADLDVELTAYHATGQLKFIRFLLNDGQCRRLARYLDEYRENNFGKNYGLSNRPRYAEGAGCSAFGVSFLEVAGLLDQEMVNAWSMSVNIPLEYAGPPLRKETVNLFNLMLHAGKWADESDAHTKLFFWDPDRMFTWTDGKTTGADSRNEVCTIGKTRGIVIDKSHLPVPEGPLWLGEHPVTETRRCPESGFVSAS